jgi:hypothetical protein
VEAAAEIVRDFVERLPADAPPPGADYQPQMGQLVIPVELRRKHKIKAVPRLGYSKINSDVLRSSSSAQQAR